MIRKLLIANRGEIACRIIRTCRELGIETVAVYSDADAHALHVALADQAVHIGAAPVAESYLRGDAILQAAQATGADAIHPGYGFLSENPEFVEAVEAAGLIFVGPSASAIRAMGLKDGAKALMEEAGVPVVPGYHGADQDAALLAREADRIGYPVLIKARAGGGGKGMRLVERAEEFAEALAAAQREGQASFGDPACLIEKYILSPRHIEVQVFGDTHGNVVHLFERDCSLQRRHQKVIEEAPAPGMTDEVRAAMGAAAVAAAKAVNYVGAGTVEFIVDGSGPLWPDGFWFMEMNTRLQVEHPVTEAVTGLDLVALQLSVAEGAPLPFAQEDVRLTGHAFEARLYAEDAAAGFLPATGPLEVLRFGSGRIDTGVRQGDEVTPHYDPMIAKIITHGPDRASALRALTRALAQTEVAGCVTNRGFLQSLSRDAAFAEGQMDTGLIARRGDDLIANNTPTVFDMAVAALAVKTSDEDPLARFRHFGPARETVTFAGDPPQKVEIAWSGADAQVKVQGDITNFQRVKVAPSSITFTCDGRQHTHAILRHTAGLTLQDGSREVLFVPHDPGASQTGSNAGDVAAPMPGRIIAVHVAKGDNVAEGDALIVLEAMKMEHTLRAPRSGQIADVLAEVSDQVSHGSTLIRFEES